MQLCFCAHEARSSTSYKTTVALIALEKNTQSMSGYSSLMAHFTG